LARPQALKRCLANLLDNAIRYGGKARVTLEDSAESLTLYIDDNGPGIPDSEQEQMFEPFRRGEASRNRATGGTGLGLAIARNLARAHGGDVTLSNRPEGGLRATLTLPRG
jgi:signal transduction histidine kinase